MYHLAMRKYFLIALILLTSLRGFVGDAMAIEMSRMNQNAPTEVQQSASVEASNHGHPCHQAKTAGIGSIQNSAECSPSASCTLCQVCHSPALQTAVSTAVSFVLPRTHDDLRVTPWMSADLVQPQKPPVL